MLFIQSDYAALVGVIVGTTALIPVMGAYIGAVLPAFLLLMVDPWRALAFLVFLGILQQIEGNVIYPRVVGTSIGLPGIWVLAAVTVGGGLFGLLGVLLSVPAGVGAVHPVEAGCGTAGWRRKCPPRSRQKREQNRHRAGGISAGPF